MTKAFKFKEDFDHLFKNQQLQQKNAFDKKNGKRSNIKSPESELVNEYMKLKEELKDIKRSLSRETQRENAKELKQISNDVKRIHKTGDKRRGE